MFRDSKLDRRESVDGENRPTQINNVTLQDVPMVALMYPRELEFHDAMCEKLPQTLWCFFLSRSTFSARPLWPGHCNDLVQAVCFAPGGPIMVILSYLPSSRASSSSSSSSSSSRLRRSALAAKFRGFRGPYGVLYRIL